MASDMSFFSRAPLGEAKVNVLANKKRVSSASGALAPSAVAAKKPRGEQQRALLTPQPSSGAPEPSSDGAGPVSLKFKIPALPVRLTAPPTPSTSTVAASSSPRRSSPIRRKPKGKHYVLLVRSAAHSHTDALLEQGTTLIFGRHHTRAAPPTMQLASIPEALRTHLTEEDNDVRVVVLDRAARHASRMHAAVELADGGKTVRLLVLGQNGVRVRTSPVGKHRRLLAGQVATFSPSDKLEIDFYGASVAVRVEEEDRERLFTPEVEMDRAASPLSLPPSSPPLAPVEDSASESEEEEEDEVEAEARRQRAGTPRPPAVLFSRSSSPLSEPDTTVFGLLPPIRVPPASAVPASLVSPALATTAGSRPGSATASPRSHPRSKPATPRGSPSTPSAAQIAVKTELVVGTHPPRAGTPKSRPSTPPLELPPFPEGLDLAALLASTVVFSGSSKLSLPDLVKSLLEVG